MLENPAAEKIIVALDVSTEDEAAALVEQIGGVVGYFKIGLQLFTRAGAPVVKRIQQTGAKVFLDLKFHDIPNTVSHAVESACDLGVQMLTIHLCGGGEMISAAAKAAAKTETLVLGVTVLTSSNRETLAETGVESAVEPQVLRLAALAKENGVRGLVASPQELAALRETFGDFFTIVTPGVRPAWSAANDQKRILTPAEAVRAGASHLVIGRPITAHAKPREAALKIAAEIAAA
jgi:orotidine-5'-phosphate decarboxylase